MFIIIRFVISKLVINIYMFPKIKYMTNDEPPYIAHWSRFPVFVQQLFSSRFLADFDAQYSKLGVFGVEEFFFSKKL